MEQSEEKEKPKYEVFISHASEDKDMFVRPLVDELERSGIRVFYDERSIGLGDSLRQKIDEGLATAQRWHGKWASSGNRFMRGLKSCRRRVRRAWRECQRDASPG
jgi:hypothetical protein